MKTSNDFSVEAWPIEKIVPCEHNVKVHPDEQIDKLALAIQRFGWDQPIVVDKKGVIIKGHGRRLAAIKLGLKKVPVVCRSDLTPAQVEAARLADNTVVSTEFDHDMMATLGIIIGRDAINELEGIMTPIELDFILDASLDVIDTDSLTLDIDGDVEHQKNENDARADEIDSDKVPIGAALGFKHVTGADQRLIKRFMAEIEAETGEEGGAAFITWLRSLLKKETV